MLNLTSDVLYKDGSVQANSYQSIGEDGAIPTGDVLLTTEQLEQISQVQGKKALLITVDTSPEEHSFPLNELDAIFIEFAGFGDGRGYSFATLLRRQGFQGELRAVGDVFKDVLNYLMRSGFDSFVIKEGKDIAEAAQGLKDFTTPYQASTAVREANYQTGKA
ncbi:MAG: DUF934 domain-containing protein [Acinetobacter sp.]|nr:DUF934 domain-containing protein [Acinetobacter sp.]